MKQKTKARKILIVSRNLPPLIGSMERLNWHIADELSKFAEVKVAGKAPETTGEALPSEDNGFL